MNKITKAKIFFFSLLFIIIGSLVALGITGEHVEIFLALIFGSALILGVFAPDYYRVLLRATFVDTSNSFVQEKHLSQAGKVKFDISLLQKIFGLIYKNYWQLEYEKFLFEGEIEKTSFVLFNFSCVKYLRGSPDKIQSTFILATPPIKDFDNIILITPLKFYSKKSYEILPKVDIDTQKIFNVYAQKPQEVSKYINEDFISALIKYHKKIDTRISLLLTPENIFLIKPKYYAIGLLKYIPYPLFMLRSKKKREESQRREYNQILDGIEVLNLLKKD